MVREKEQNKKQNCEGGCLYWHLQVGDDGDSVCDDNTKRFAHEQHNRGDNIQAKHSSGCNCAVMEKKSERVSERVNE